MRKSFLLLSIIAAISVVAAEAPAAQAAFNQPGEKVALPDNFAFDNQTPQIIQGEKFQFQVCFFYIHWTRLFFFLSRIRTQKERYIMPGLKLTTSGLFKKKNRLKCRV